MLKDVFDVKSLDDFQLGHLQFVLNSPSYLDVFEPYLRNMRNSLNVRLLDPRESRKCETPDDFLRGAINSIDGLLNLFEQLIHETDIEKIHNSQILTETEQYAKARREKRITPFSGIVEDIEPPPNIDEDY